MPGFLNPLLQPPLPSILNLIPPLSLLQWIPRTLLLIYTLLTLPLILLSVPISVLFLSSSSSRLHACAPLALHPDAIPPVHSFFAAVLRGWIVYTMSGAVWAITALGAPPVASEKDAREAVFTHVRVYETVARLVERVKQKKSAGSEGRLGIREVRVKQLRGEYMRGVVKDVWSQRGREERERDDKGMQGFWLTNTVPAGQAIQKAAGAAERSDSGKEEPNVGMRRPRTYEEAKVEMLHLEKVQSITSKNSIPSIFSANRPEVSHHDEISIDLSSCSKPHKTPSPLPHSKRKVYLFFSGGGYVTGVPLAHQAITSLARTFPPESHPLDLSHPSRLPHRAVFAPNIRKALSFADSFPMPLIDALSAYQYLLDVGYEPEEVILVGNSAGGGMVWSVLAYLCALVQEQEAAGVGATGYREHVPDMESVEDDLDAVEDLLDKHSRQDQGGVNTNSMAKSTSARSLGLPKGVIMVSPWVSLPPAPEAETPYPDFPNAPQLLNAARSYLARFPIIPERSDPFVSEWPLWRKWMFGRRGKGEESGAGEGKRERVDVEKAERAEHALHIRRRQLDHLQSTQLTQAQGDVATSTDETPASLVGWLQTPHFTRLTSHHPLYSPCSFPLSHPIPPLHLLQHLDTPNPIKNPASDSPFVQQVLTTLNQNHSKMLIISATGEWFHHPTRLLAEAVAEAGVDVVYKQELGLIHCENFLFMAEYGRAGGRMLNAVLEWGEEVA